MIQTSEWLERILEETVHTFVIIRRFLTLLIITFGFAALDAGADDKGTGTILENEQLLKYFGGCTKKFGYDPQNLPALGPYDLAPNERPWRECAYEGVRKIIMPASVLPDMYEDIIREDKTMTDKIEQHAMTRDERRKRIEALTSTAAVNERLNAAIKQNQEFEKFRQQEMRRMSDMKRDQFINRSVGGALGR